MESRDLSAAQTSIVTSTRRYLSGTDITLPIGWARPLAAAVDWGWGYANAPTLRLLLDRKPNDAPYEKRGLLYYSNAEGLVSFFFYEKPGDGYGGSVFDITLNTGERVELRGPWSSAPSNMNKAGFHPCVDAAWTTDPEVWKRGYTMYGGHVALEVALAALDLIEAPQIGEAVGGKTVLVYDSYIYHPAIRARGGAVWRKT